MPITANRGKRLFLCSSYHFAMTEKRKCFESGAEQQTRGGSDLIAQDGDVKRARLGSWSETTLEDLPPELIESILIKAIVMEVKGLKVVNSVWKEEADLVISRLCTVCSHWSNILTTNFFRNELHKALESAQDTIRLEILHQSQIQDFVAGVSSIKDEIFLLVWSNPQGPQIDVYDRNNLAVVKDVIPLPRVHPENMVASSVSSCLFILNSRMKENHYSILRIARGNDNRFTVKPVIKDILLPQADICVSPNGNLILVRRQTKRIDAITVCDPNGYVQHTVRLPVDMDMLDRIIPKSNGNLVLVQANDQSKMKLVEISMNGDIIRQYQSSVVRYGSVCDADDNGRMLLDGNGNTMELLDSEFILKEFSGPQLIDGQFNIIYQVHYNTDRNEMMAVATDQNYQRCQLTIFRFQWS